MIKVITYGTYDMFHHGHIRLLERAKELGDYLIVGVTSDSFDRMRGKINVKQSLEERVEAVRATGLADEIIIEEYEGQKIDDIRRYDVDIFTVGSDWEGHFDYLREFCKVVYLERTQGVSSSGLREKAYTLRIGLVGNSSSELEKLARESTYVNGVEIVSVHSDSETNLSDTLKGSVRFRETYEELLNEVNAVYLVSHPGRHYQQIKAALERGIHVLCESPVAMNASEVEELMAIARDHSCILQESIKTAYALAFSRLQLLVKSGYIGDVVSVDATCTSLRKMDGDQRGSLYSWGPFGLLAVFSILGTEYRSKSIKVRLNESGEDIFTKVEFVYNRSVASVKVANGAKSEGELVVTGTNGYVYVPAPWWKTDYFEVRYENSERNKRYFYQLEGEGIRYAIVSFLRSVNKGKSETYIPENITLAISEIMGDFDNRKDTIIL
ncbi:MAG: adenylyltransferase/cytidyltransferase family protein [Clostridium sp.]|nr:adenylyltransferase/cytidyltransferase family protein [Acetatifactor muris]MCM1527318.1 adenylyltransferase/cytidyltransferase family protein [Bacteroides sp.]MCM1563597.1 adenylyltransferase/cytidyltransferase family protein [Clostridium sp.]